MVQQKDQRKKGYSTFRFDPYLNQRVGLKKEANNAANKQRKSNLSPSFSCNGNKSQSPSTTNTIGRLVSSSTIGRGINRKRLSCDNLNEINRISSLSVNNLNSITSVSTFTLSTTATTVNNNESPNKRGLSSLEPSCQCCTPRNNKLTKNASTTNLRQQRSNNQRCASSQKLDDSRRNLNSHKDIEDESNPLERYVPSQELYRRVVKEHLQLQSSFQILCQRLEEEKERSVTESKEKQSLKEEINNLMQKVDLLAMELQEARDQNELMEFRILESEQSKITFSETPNLLKCDKAIQLEPSKEEEEIRKRVNLLLPSPGNHNTGKMVKPESAHGNGSSELFLYSLPNKRSVVSMDGLTGSTKSNKSCSSLESYALTLSLTSEDEGLGDDGRRDQFSGPSSLSDIQMSDEESNSSTRSSGISSSKSTDVAIQTSDVAVVSNVTSPCPYCKESTNLTDKVNRLLEERDSLQEQVLELEEAENDARLVSQRLQRQVENLVNQVDCLQISLVKANQQIEQGNDTIRSLRECELKLKVDFMMALIAKSEDSPSKLLDELKAKLKEKKNELASMGPMVFSSFNTFDDRSIDLMTTSPSPSSAINGSSSNRHNFKQAIYNQQQSSAPGNPFLQNHHQQYLQLTSFTDGGPDDCEIFVPEDSLPPDPGSSFHVQMLTSARYNNNCRPPSQSTTTTFTSSRSPLPLCETVKPKKIDLLLSSPSPTYSSSSSPPLSSSSSPLVSPASSSSSSSSSSNQSLPSPLSPYLANAVNQSN